VSLISCVYCMHAANEGLACASQSSNPLHCVEWGHYLPRFQASLAKTDSPSYYYYTANSTSDRSVFQRVVLTPRARWFGQWYPGTGGGTANIKSVMEGYVHVVTGDNPDVGVQAATFGINPWEGSACHLKSTQMSSQARQQYLVWLRNFIAGLGNARAMIVVQPDLWFSQCDKAHPKYLVQQVRMTVRLLAKRPRTTLYLDAGASDWMHPRSAVKLLKACGVQYIRGFALGATHYVSDNDQYWYGRSLVNLLRHMGIRGKHFIINRSYNGHPFRANLKKPFFILHPCTSPNSHSCVAIGRVPYIPPGGLCDGYVWFGLPWQNNTRQSTYDEFLAVAGNSPYIDQYPPPALLNDPRGAPKITHKPKSFYGPGKH